jgi:hypothetical protein
MIIEITRDEDSLIDLNNIMDYGRVINCKRRYITIDGDEIRGHDFLVLDKEGETIPNCISVNPKRRTYKQLHTDENGNIVLTTDTGINDGWHKWSGILEGDFTDEDIQVVYKKGII